MRSSGWSLLVVAACLLSGSRIAVAVDDWPQFRGPSGQGHANGAEVPIQFGLEQAVRWRTPLEGKGWSSPVVASDKIWLTTAITQPATPEQQEKKLAGDPMAKIKEVAGSLQVKAVCLDFKTGAILHSIALADFDSPEPIHPLNTYASPTAVIHDGRVYCHFGNYGTWCLNADSGETIWHKQIVVNYSVGPGSSPLIQGDNLVLVCDGIDAQFIVALDKSTGEEVWRTARPPKRSDVIEYHKAYSTPLVVEVAGKAQLVIPSAQWICGYDPANGQEIWRIDHGDGFSGSICPIAVEGLVVFATGYMRSELVAVRADGTGDVSQTHIAWRCSRGAPMKPSPIAVGDRIYMVSDDGILTQVHAADGSIAWQERLSGNFSASPIHANGKLYFCSHEGAVTVVADGPKFDRVAKNQLEDGLLASPAVVGNDLLVRTGTALLRIGN